MTVMQTVARRASQAFLNVVLPQRASLPPSSPPLRRSAAADGTGNTSTPLVTVSSCSGAEGGAGSGHRASIASARASESGEATVDKYKEHFSFLRDSKFLQELENDSVDSEIIEQELSALQQVPIRNFHPQLREFCSRFQIYGYVVGGTREKAVKFLQSNPVQILLCVIVLLDAGIVIAQILLDLNSVKDKLVRRNAQLSEIVQYIRATQPERLHGYTGSDVDFILRLLREDPESDMNHTSSSLMTPLDSFDVGSLESQQSTESDSIRSGISPTSRYAIDGSGNFNVADWHFVTVDHNEYDVLHEVAHGLHFASIAMLGFLVVEDFIKIIAMGKVFFKHKIEIFDAFIIASSFAIDIVFLGGVSGEEGQKAAALLVILLLWRIARVVDGILVTVKQRQEFRIRLQKRARRIAERKLETVEEERHARTRQIEALKDLCAKAGITDADIAACAPFNQNKVNTTLCALSSVARLSVSMTMLMSSGVYRPRNVTAIDDCAAAACAAAAAAAAADVVLPRQNSGPKLFRLGSTSGGRDSSSSHGSSGSSIRRSLIAAGTSREPKRIESLPTIRNGVTAGSDDRQSVAALSKITGGRSSKTAVLRKSASTAATDAEAAGYRRKRGALTRSTTTTGTGKYVLPTDRKRYESDGGKTKTSSPSVVVDVEPTTSGVTVAIDAVKPLTKSHLSDAGTEVIDVVGGSGRTGCLEAPGLQSPVNCSGIRIVIDSESDCDDDKAARKSSMATVDDEETSQQPVDNSATSTTSSATTLSSSSQIEFGSTDSRVFVAAQADFKSVPDVFATASVHHSLPDSVSAVAKPDGAVEASCSVITDTNRLPNVEIGDEGCSNTSEPSYATGSAPASCDNKPATATTTTTTTETIASPSGVVERRH